MPQDPNLYGQPPPKKRKNNMALSSSMDFTAQLSSIISGPFANAPTVARPRPSRTKDNIFTGAKSRRQNDSPGKAGSSSKADSAKLKLRDPLGTDEESSELARTRRKMEEKARLYTAMKRGDYVPKENEAAPLVDFDRKWAEAEARGRKDDDEDALSSDSDDDDDNRDDGGRENANQGIVEYEDEFGRLRRGTKVEIERLERQRRRGLLGAEELERMSARPAAPAKLLHGDAIQTMAFNPEDPEKMEELARKRDRSATPPDLRHYDADSEIRTKGTGFYKFSKDEETRSKEFESLEAERQRTETARKDREEKKEARRKEIEQRRKDVEARRAQKLADSFLDDLATDLKG
ncbi:Coiled-coil domain-containing protein 174 [Colletotrichum aenigma]|uniref:Coiled-coil domain-containing protein 174 n=1 Tax=Colletotrichum aenigma TaxID=1215731 RepID=UPI00187245F1|nr:Coiled-coil domain-containing protein 174 [Colletotrichum aenigma]KAF5501880.1 Coiled-coil domain-containing protein 174 [Colletotrichum aenigma]